MMMKSRPDPSIAVRALKSAAPYIRMYKNKVFVIKAGGAVFADEASSRALIEQVAILHQVGIKTVLVHGGGPQLDHLQETLGLETEMVNGRRVTDQKSIDVTAMVLNGLINTRILAHLPGARHRGHRPLRRRCRADPRAQARAGAGIGRVERIGRLRLRRRHRFGQRRGDREAAGERPDAGGQPAVRGFERHPAQHQRRHRGGRARRRAVRGEAGAVHRRTGNTRARAGHELGHLLHRHQGTESPARRGQPHGRHAAQGDGHRAAIRGGVRRVHVITYKSTDSLLAEIFTNEGTGTLVVADLKALSPAEQLGAAQP